SSLMISGGSSAMQCGWEWKPWARCRGRTPAAAQNPRLRSGECLRQASRQSTLNTPTNQALSKAFGFAQSGTKFNLRNVCLLKLNSPSTSIMSSGKHSERPQINILETIITHAYLHANIGHHLNKKTQPVTNGCSVASVVSVRDYSSLPQFRPAPRAVSSSIDISKSIRSRGHSDLPRVRRHRYSTSVRSASLSIDMPK
ncbi:hypothetical protein B0H13DRAFT_2064855, partial [Mycena leptocephala]